jgi:prepilin-type N-terminal cleavage/methylation domain-containing protein
MKKNTKLRGFTLLELVVTIGIIALLVGIGVPSFYAYSKQNAARTSVQDIKNVLLEAQSLAKSPAAVDSGSDFYYVTINYDQTVGNSNNGEIEIGKGKFNSNGVVLLPYDPLRTPYHIDSDAWVTSVSPDDPQVPGTKEITYYFLIPSGQILFNNKEPSPGFGYSPRCKSSNNDSSCHYDRRQDKNSYIQIRVKDTADSPNPQDGDQTVIIDGNGGSINILDGLIEPN